MNFNKSSFLILPALLVCLCAGCSENNTCSSNFDCKSGISCDYEKHTCTCEPECGDRKCGFTPATCDYPSAVCGSCPLDRICDESTGTCGASVCGSCPLGQICDESTGTCSVCDPQCGTRKCGSTPASCDNPSATCGTCPTECFCIAITGLCDCVGPCRGCCKCETQQSCSIPCPTAPGAANTCILTNETTGDGFCSFACSAEGADSDCTGPGDFPGGCCEDLSEDGSGENFCMKSEYCDAEPGNQEYLQKCGTEADGNCITGLICVGFSDTEEWGYCIYDCPCPSPDSNGECPEATCTDNGLCVELSSTAQTSKGGCIPPGNQPMEGFCHRPDNSCADGLICINYGEIATSGNGMCTPFCDNSTGVPCVDPMDCILPLANDKWACSRPCPSQNKSDCPNNGTGWQCYDIGNTGSPNYICIPE
jgi:hypothetical protein